MTSEQNQKLLKAEVAATLHSETGKVPTREQIEEVSSWPVCSTRLSSVCTSSARSRRQPGNCPSSNHAH